MPMLRSRKETTTKLDTNVDSTTSSASSPYNKTLDKMNQPFYCGRKTALLLLSFLFLMTVSTVAITKERESREESGFLSDRMQKFHASPHPQMPAKGYERKYLASREAAPAMAPAVTPSSTGSFESASTFSTTAMSEEMELDGDSVSDMTLGSTVLKALENQQSDEEGKRSKKAISKMLIDSGTIGLSLPKQKLGTASNVEPVSDSIQNIVVVDGNGYVESISKSQDRYGNRWSMQLRVKVLNTKFYEVIKKIQDIASDASGNIEDFTTHSRDVTDQYVDATARADALKASRKAIEKILSKADKVRDVIEIQRELNSLIQQEESYRKRALQLKNSSNMSSITVTISQSYEHESPPKKQEYKWDPSTAVNLALKHMVVAFQYIVDVSGYALVWTVPIVIIVRLLMYIAG